jgi:hypothetical protein
MKVLLDEGQVGVISPGNPPKPQVFNSISHQGQLVMGEVVNLPQPKPGEKPVMGFPNVNTCQGVVCVLKDGTIVGTHIASQDDEKRQLALMKDIINKNGSGIATMYVARRDRSKDIANGMEPGDKAKELGFKGTLRTFDTGQGSKNEGVYVQFSPMGDQGKCLVEYKKNEKMAYGTVNRNAINPITQKERNTVPTKVGAELYSGSKQTQLHEAKVKSVKVK